MPVVSVEYDQGFPVVGEIGRKEAEDRGVIFSRDGGFVLFGQGSWYKVTKDVAVGAIASPVKPGVLEVRKGSKTNEPCLFITNILQGISKGQFSSEVPTQIAVTLELIALGDSELDEKVSTFNPYAVEAAKLLYSKKEEILEKLRPGSASIAFVPGGQVRDLMRVWVVLGQKTKAPSSGIISLSEKRSIWNNLVRPIFQAAHKKGMRLTDA